MKLASRPVDSSHLEQRMGEVLREPEESPSSPLVWQRWWRPVTAAAAAILIAVTVGWFAQVGGTTPTMAAPAALAQIHFDLTKGFTPHLEVSTVAEANRLLAEQSNGITPLPALPGALRSCCLHQLAGTTITCALVELEGLLITIAVGSGQQIHSLEGKTITRNGRTFIIHTANGINMVMANQGNRWLCVMGGAPTEKLVDVAVDIRM